MAVRQYWEEKRRGRPMPARADIDPIELRRFLPGIILIDVVDDERRYVYRLVGTREVAMRGKDPTGQSMVEGFFAPNLEAALAIPDQVVATRAPLFVHRDFIAPDGRLGYEDLIMLPLSEDGLKVTMIMGYTHHRLA
ncbi:PAS domain-containing protein [Dongia sedimenti]|uniref:PAS domain-containing protein n=1 Tax=Dongia sedimenti TaxID=3064282 RepID=A0ABU0YQN4_9PROT|nr:PAS domain-containing protein [Rhodospirillaceae bacterium R-7]